MTIINPIWPPEEKMPGRLNYRHMFKNTIVGYYSDKRDRKQQASFKWLCINMAVNSQNGCQNK